MNKALIVGVFALGAAAGVGGREAFVADAVAQHARFIYPEQAEGLDTVFRRYPAADGGTQYGVSAEVAIPAGDDGGEREVYGSQEPWIPPAPARQAKFKECHEFGVRAVLRERRWLDGGTE